MSLAGILKGGFHDSHSLPPDFVDELAKGGKRPGYSNLRVPFIEPFPSYVTARSICTAPVPPEPGVAATEDEHFGLFPLSRR
ncbi:MAG TPA: hypothetical protein VM689_14590 [Aliidongia sp.]|nr:hypothetical protein [Aliidongia sp.]